MNTKDKSITAQDLSPKELKICALLYSCENGVLFDFTKIVNMSSGELIHFNGEMRLDGDEFHGTWYGKPFHITLESTAQSLVLKKLLVPQKKHDLKFYVLTKRQKNFKEFFKELRIQIALGSI